MGANLIKSSRVTILQVAEAAGVDRSTVSRVYNQPEMLREATIERVKSVAMELGYSPNPAARALRTGHIENISLIVPDLTNPFIPPIALAVQKESANKGYCVFIGNADEDPSHEEQLLTRFLDQVSGAILVSPRSHSSVIEAMARRLPIVLINRDIQGIPRVLIDSGKGMALAVSHLAHLGHTRLAYIGGPPQSWANEERRRAVFRAAGELGISCVEAPAEAASFSAGTQLIDELLTTGATAFLAFDDVLAQGIYFGITERGFDVPRDFSLVGCDDIPGLPLLTTVSSQSILAGKMATDLLIDSLLLGERSDACKVLETSLILRNTVAAPRAAS